MEDQKEQKTNSFVNAGQKKGGPAWNKIGANITKFLIGLGIFISIGMLLLVIIQVLVKGIPHLKGELYNSGSLTKDCALLIGNEARGLSEEISAKADKLIKIPMHGKVESLNAAVATAILMYEAAR